MMVPADMRHTWTAAGGEHQVPFMAAASRATRGELGRCPKCRAGSLRCYFHEFRRERRQGSLWLWCGACRTFTCLSRVQAHSVPVDPFAGLTTHEFAELERSEAEPFLDRLERLWVDGVLVTASESRE